MADDSQNLLEAPDYLGRNVPVSLAEKPVLPTGGSLAGTPASAANAGPGFTQAQLGTPTTSVGTGVSGVPQVGASGSVTAKAPQLTLPAEGADPMAILNALVSGGGSLENLYKAFQQMGIEVPSDLTAGTSPQDLRLFDRALSEFRLDTPQGFVESSPLGTGVQLPSTPGDTPPTEGPPGISGDGGIFGDIAGAAFPAANLGLSLMGSNNIPGSLVKFATQFAPQAGALLAGTSLADLGSATFNPFLAAWNLPSLVGNIAEMIDPRESQASMRRRAERTRDANELQRDMLTPVINAKTPEDFVAALKTPVGGSTTGQALADILYQNLHGGWFSDTQHDWIPDLSLLPLMTTLESLGYVGSATDPGPRKNNVGGVGEIVQGAGFNLFTPEQQRALETGPTQGSVQGENWIAPRNTDWKYGSPGARGYDSFLRELTQLVTGAQATQAPNVFDVIPPVVEGPTYEGGFGMMNASANQPLTAPSWLQNTPVDQGYFAALQGFDPASAQRIQDELQQRQNDANAVAASWNNPGG